MLLITCDFHENRLSENRRLLLLWAKMKLVYLCTVKRHDSLKVKNALLESVCCVTEFIIGSTLFKCHNQGNDDSRQHLAPLCALTR